MITAIPARDAAPHWRVVRPCPLSSPSLTMKPAFPRLRCAAAAIVVCHGNHTLPPGRPSAPSARNTPAEITRASVIEFLLRRRMPFMPV